MERGVVVPCDWVNRSVIAYTTGQFVIYAWPVMAFQHRYVSFAEANRTADAHTLPEQGWELTFWQEFKGAESL